MFGGPCHLEREARATIGEESLAGNALAMVRIPSMPLLAAAPDKKSGDQNRGNLASIF